MKPLEKDRSRRYETANGFAMDFQRYLRFNSREPTTHFGSRHSRTVLSRLPDRA